MREVTRTQFTGNDFDRRHDHSNSNMKLAEAT